MNDTYSATSTVITHYSTYLTVQRRDGSCILTMYGLTKMLCTCAFREKPPFGHNKGVVMLGKAQFSPHQHSRSC